MASPSFGVPSSNNNAPLPIPGNTNPTGTNTGVSFNGASFPNYPMYGTPSFGTATPSSNSPLFSSNSFSGMNSGFGFLPGGNQFGSDLYNQLGKAYGKGTGQELGNIITQGLFNPESAAAFLNAMQPAHKQGQASILDAFGAEGSRFGSAAAIGLGNYESQFNLNEQQTLATMYMQAQQEQLQLLEGVLPTIHGEKANSGGWIHDLIGGLEIAGGVASMFVPGLQGAGIGLMGAGAGQLGQGLTPSGGGGNSNSNSFNPLSPIPNMWNSNTGTFGNNAPNQWDQLWADMQNESAGSALGGVDTSQLLM